MANQITGNPWEIDTASATAVTADTKLIAGFYWDVGTSGAADDALVVTDTLGNVKWASHATAKNDGPGITFAEGLVCAGIKVTTMTHGKLYIYFKR